MPKTLEDLEAESSAILDRDLQDPRALISGTSHLLGKALTALGKIDFENRSASTKVAILLSVRIANDLRGVSLLTKVGYGIQAASLASSIYEIAYTVAYIGADNKLAEQWLTHDQVLSTPFRNILKLTEGGLLRLDVPDSKTQALSEYQN